MPLTGIDKVAGGNSPFRDLFETMNDAVTWLAECGLSYDRLRLGQYRRDIEDLIRADESGSLPEIVRERISVRLAASLLEAGELRRLFKGLVFFADGPLEKGLRSLIRRAGQEADDHVRNSTDNPRDLGLELTLAARLSACSFGIQISDDGLFEADVGGRPVLFDCTRIHSARDIGARIRDAQKRLAERCSGREGSRGIMALAITRMQDIGLDFLTSPDPMQLTRRMELAIDGFLDHYEHLWARPVDGSLIGVWIYASRPVLIGNTNRLLYAQRFALESAPHISAEDDDLLWLIDERFRFLAELTSALL